MNINDSQIQDIEGQPNIDFCVTIFSTPGQEVSNAYKCSQKQFSASDIWNIQKQKRPSTISQNIIVSGQ